ncbi:hypothetical protein Y032_0025g1171 [Ancylostoma ceylanicum]|uniref:Uncharacterized protein n=1 Tax=Ancylostoma ceylanicum TaxID=53326 RepID=A0A016UUK7_9BILA|nr:hypothetical protein Y032_0025g1171 [Ancylostoma ceylanicum]
MKRSGKRGDIQESRSEGGEEERVIRLPEIRYIPKEGGCDDTAILFATFGDAAEDKEEEEEEEDEDEDDNEELDEDVDESDDEVESWWLLRLRCGTCWLQSGSMLNVASAVVVGVKWGGSKQF